MIRISLIHASYNSEGQAVRVRDSWLSLAKYPKYIEHCLGFQGNDKSVRREFRIPTKSHMGISRDSLTRFVATDEFPGISAVRNWNAAASISTGELLLAIADDLVPPPNWDEQIYNILTQYGQKDELLLVFSDARCDITTVSGVKDTFLPRHPLLTRKLYNRFGYLFNPQFAGHGPDVYWLIVGLKEGFLRDARTLKFHHSYGHIFGDRAELKCGCDGLEHIDSKMTASKLALIDELEQVSPRHILDALGIRWRFIEALFMTQNLCEFIYEGYLYRVHRGLRITPEMIILTTLFKSGEGMIGKIKLVYLLSKSLIDFARRNLKNRLNNRI